MTKRKTNDDHHATIEDDDEHLDQLERGPATATDHAEAEPAIATEDTWIPRPDLGPNFTTYVPAGHPLPAGHAATIELRSPGHGEDPTDQRAGATASFHLHATAPDSDPLRG